MDDRVNESAFFFSSLPGGKENTWKNQSSESPASGTTTDWIFSILCLINQPRQFLLGHFPFLRGFDCIKGV
jgi:hypothetical protein